MPRNRLRPHSGWKSISSIRRVQRQVAQRASVALRRLVDGDEPLLRARSEDHGRLAAPVVRVAVHVKRSDRGRGDRDSRRCSVTAVVGVPHAHAAQPLRHGVVVRAVVLDRAVDRRALRADARVVVLGAVPGRGVHEPGAVLEGDVRRPPPPGLTRSQNGWRYWRPTRFRPRPSSARISTDSAFAAFLVTDLTSDPWRAP